MSKETKKKEPKKATKKEVLTDPNRNDGSVEMKHFVDEAMAILPNEKDDWRIMELATFLSEQSKLIRKYWGQMNEIARRSDEKTLAFAMSFSSVRKSNPPEATAKISFSENWRDSLKVKVPDPSQTVLPLEEGEKAEAASEE